MFTPGVPAPAGSIEIVGREPEQERIEAFLAGVPDGVCSLLLAGEPGIGKTVLWRWGVERARHLGYRVVSSRPAEEEMFIPLAAIADLLDDTDAAAALAPDADQMTRGRVVLQALRTLAADLPVIIAIDDLQWLDSASARALRFGLRRLDSEPIGLLATSRTMNKSDDGVFSAALLPGRASTLEVGPLPIESMRSLLAGAVTSISRPMLRRIHQMSGGNPFYALELARYRGAENANSRPAVPASLGDALTGRLTGHSAAVTRLLDVVAVLGRASLSTLEALLPDVEVAAGVEGGLAAGLLAVEEDGDVRFSHALLGSAAYERLSQPERTSWHGAIAAIATDPDLRAWHLAMSAETPDEEVAAIIEQAADRAADRGAPDIAAQLAAHSVRLTPPELAAASHRRTLAQVEQLAGAGEVGRAQSVVTGLIATLPAGPARAQAMVRLWEIDDDLVAGDAWLTQALEEAAGDDRLRIRILSALGRGRDYLGDLAGGIEACREALITAERVGDPGVEMSAATTLAYLETKAGVPRFDLMERAIRLEHDSPIPVLTQGPSELMVNLLLWQGELPEARRLLAQTRARAAEAGLEWKSLQYDFGVAMLESMAGNLDVAEVAAQRAVMAAQDAEDPWSERILLYPYGLIAAWLGRTEIARAVAERLIRDAQDLKLSIIHGRRVLGLLALAAGDWRAAAAELVQASDLSEASGVRHPGVNRELPDVVEAVALSGDLASAETYLARLEREAAAVAAPWPDAAAVRARGAFLLAGGEGDDAAELLGEAAARFDQLGFGPDAARSRLLQGRALGRAGHRSRAAQALADAHDRFAATGAVVWRRKTAEELERVAPGRSSGVLTQTESRIAGLIGEGLRNREIAEALFMSVATVEAHLTRIYRKLDIRSRTELSRLVASGELPLSDEEQSS